MTAEERARGLGDIPGWKLHGCAGCDGTVYVKDDHHPKTPAYCSVCEHARRRTMSKKSKKKNGASEQLAATNPETGAERREIKRYVDELPVRIDDAAVASLADKLAEFLATRDSVEEQKKAASAAFKERLDELDALISSTAASVRSKTEKREVEVREFLNPDNSVEVIRVDTGEVIETRTAEAEDLQPELFDDEGDTEPPPSQPPPPVEGDTTDLAQEQGEAST